MTRVSTLNHEVSAGNRGGYHVRTGFDTIFDYFMLCAVQLTHTADPNQMRSRTFDGGAHFFQEKS